jgi:hypothetical protein
LPPVSCTGRSRGSRAGRVSSPQGRSTRVFAHGADPTFHPERLFLYGLPSANAMRHSTSTAGSPRRGRHRRRRRSHLDRQRARRDGLSPSAACGLIGS